MFKQLKAGAVGLALVLAICSAFTNAPNVQRAETLYGVTQETPDSFRVMDLTGLTEGPDYTCAPTGDACTIKANSEDVSNGAVAKADAQIITPGEFQEQ